MVAQAQPQATNDPMQSAMEAEAPNGLRTYFGRVNIDTWYCVLKKGQGKVLFDAGVHSADQRCTAIEIDLDPLPGSKANFSLKREMIAESNEWGKIIKPSLRGLNTDLRAINGKYAQVQIVPTGRKYTDNSGVEKDSTTFKFIAIYNTEEDCASASSAFWNRTDSAGVAPTTPSAPPIAAVNNNERETALKFLPALYNASGKDINKFGEILANNPLVSKYFSLSSKEVIDLVSSPNA